MQNFNNLGLDGLLLKAISKEGYQIPTPIQTQVIPKILEGKDILGIAQTGTGKTAAFALPIIQKICITNRQPPQRKTARALILCPTRELATQIGESFRVYGNFIQLSIAVVYGGVSHKPQREKLNRGVDILIATPGRLLDHLRESNLTLDGTEILVLDEADQMLDLGFIDSLRRIISALPHRRQSLFFSATMPPEISLLAGELLKNPIKISVHQDTKVADDVEQKVIFVDHLQKQGLLIEFFNNLNLQRAIVFTRTKRGADRVAKFLETAGINVGIIHGDKSQNQRNSVIQAFKNSRVRALIATDIASRGIDIDAVSHVINYELPNIPEIYVHRIGRTARAGAQGIAISFVDPQERSYLRNIERLTKQKIPSTDRSQDLYLKKNDPKPQNTKGRSDYPKETKFFDYKRKKKKDFSGSNDNRKTSQRFKYKSEQPTNERTKMQSPHESSLLKKSFSKEGTFPNNKNKLDATPPTESSPTHKYPYRKKKSGRKFHSYQKKRREQFSQH